MSARLPAPLEAAIAQRLVGVSRTDLAARAARISDHYRAQGQSRDVIRAGADAAAYALSRLPGTYAAVDAVFGAIRERAADFSPASVLDVGAGPGGASWAAVSHWPELAAISFLDSNPSFLDLAIDLAKASDHPALAAVEPISDDFVAFAKQPRSADLVVASYALAEVKTAKAVDAARGLWNLTLGMMVVVEPGTPAGFERILAVRAALIEAGGAVVAPCPHSAACPMQSPAWCHFGQRLARSRDHRLVKGAESPFEDEKYAYVALARPGIAGPARGARVMSTPRLNKIGLAYQACASDGLVDRRISRRERLRLARARRLDWGDWVEAEEGGDEHPAI